MRGRYNGVYSGVCVGGPCDGQQASYHSPFFRMPKRQPLAAITAKLPDKLNPNEVLHLVGYVHTAIDLPDHDEPLFFWRQEHETMREAMLRLLANYPRGTVRVAGGEPDGA